VIQLESRIKNQKNPGEINRPGCMLLFKVAY